MKDAPISPAELEALEQKLRAGLALVDATTGECMAGIDELPRNAWSEAALAILDEAPRLIEAARRATPSLVVLQRLLAEVPEARQWLLVGPTNQENSK